MSPIAEVAEKVPFGKQFREKYYSFEEGITPLNHGSYGCPPTPVIDAYKKHMMEDLAWPDRYLRFTGLSDLQHAVREVAKIVDADPNNLAFVTNATTAVNTVLRSYPFAKGDKIVIQSTVYGACGNTVKFLKNRYGIEIVVVDLTYPMEDDEVVDAFEAAFKESKIKLAMFDAITSMPGVRMPFERLIALCKKYDVLSLVDGAHSIGLIPYSLSELKPDFFTSNLHKWFSTPRGCAYIYADAKHHRVIHTLPVSHTYLDDNEDLPEDLEKSRFTDRFIWTGSIGLASFMSSLDAIKFRNEVCGGEEAIQKYTHGLAKEASALVVKAWGTELLQNKSETLMTAMFNVKLPVDEEYSAKCDTFPKLLKAKNFIEWTLIDKYKTFIPIDYHGGALWARFSCEVYNELSDYEYGAKVFPDVLKEFAASDVYKTL